MLMKTNSLRQGQGGNVPGCISRNPLKTLSWALVQSLAVWRSQELAACLGPLQRCSKQGESSDHKSEIGSIFRNPTKRLTATVASKEYAVVTLDQTRSDLRQLHIQPVVQHFDFVTTVPDQLKSF